MTNAQAWSLILGDIGHFLAYFGIFPWIGIVSLVDRAPSDGRYYPGTTTMIGWVWAIYICGLAAKYW